MNILLINPEFPDTFWSFHNALPFEGKRAAFPPLGLMTVAALLPKSWSKQLVDLEAGDALKTRDIEKADMVFVTGMLIQKKAILRIIRQCKKLGKKVVLGGPFASTNHEPIPEVDHMFIGEAETTLPQFVLDLKLGEAQAVYQAAERPLLSLTPIADFSLVNLKRYSAMSVQYSRGCPFSCEFCDIIQIYGRVPRTKSNAQIIAELDTLLDLGWRGSVFIVDDNFIGNKKNVRTLLPELVAWQKLHGYPFGFLTEASANLADDEDLLEQMRLAGFQKVFVGIETPVEASLIAMKKTQNAGRSLLDCVRTLQDYGLEVMAGFIIGNDDDPEDIFELQMNFIRDGAIPLAMSGLLSALPDTDLWKRLEKAGRLLWESAGSNTMDSLNFKTVMDRKWILENYARMMETLYSSREYYGRVLGFLRRTPKRKPVSSGFNLFSGILALARVAWKLGVIENDRNEFWAFLWQAASKHRDRFVQAVRLAAMGYHFRKLNETGL